MAKNELALELIPDSLAVVRLDPQAEQPGWANGAFVSVTRTTRELSIVCPAGRVPDNVKSEAGFRCLSVEGPLDFSEVGILAALARPLARAGISLFAVSTFETDHLLVRQTDLDAAISALEAAGHTVRAQSSPAPGSPRAERAGS